MRNGDVRGLWAVPDLCPGKPCAVRVPDARMDGMEIFKSVRKNLRIFSPDTSETLVSERFRLFSRDGYRSERIPRPVPRRPDFINLFVLARKSPLGKLRRKQNRIDKIGRSEQNPGGLCSVGRFGFRRSGPEMRNGDVRGLSMIRDLCPGKPCAVRVPDARMDWMEIFKSVRKKLRIFSPDTSETLVSERFRLLTHDRIREQRIPRPVPRRPDFINLFLYRLENPRSFRSVDP